MAAPPAGQSQFGSYGQPSTMPRPAAAPAGGKPVRAIVGSVTAFVVVFGLFAAPRVMDQLHRHHTGALPDAVAGYTQLDPSVEAAISQRLEQSMPSRFDGKLHRLQAAVYQQGRSIVFVATAEGPAGMQRHPNVPFENNDGTDEFHDVVAPVSTFGGKTRCSTYTADAISAQACGWVDDGTFGFVMATSADEPTTIQLLAELRTAVEH